MRRSAILLLTLLAAGCGGGGNDAEPVVNDARLQEQRMHNMAQDIAREAENRTSAIERALENETEAVFESRNALLNEAADNAAAPAENQASTNAAQP